MCSSDLKDWAAAMNQNSPLNHGQDVPPLNDALPPIRYEKFSASSDVGDVQHIVPCASFTTTTANSLSGSHTWLITCCSGNSIGFKGMLRAGKVMAAAAGKFYRNPELVKEAKENFEKDMAGKTYNCPIPKDIPIPQPEK